MSVYSCLCSFIYFYLTLQSYYVLLWWHLPNYILGLYFIVFVSLYLFLIVSTYVYVRIPFTASLNIRCVSVVWHSVTSIYGDINPHFSANIFTGTPLRWWYTCLFSWQEYVYLIFIVTISSPIEMTAITLYTDDPILLRWMLLWTSKYLLPYVIYTQRRFLGTLLVTLKSTYEREYFVCL